MTQFHFYRGSHATLGADAPLVRADDAARIGTLTDLIVEVEAERSALPAAREAARDEGFAEGRAEGVAAGRAEALEAASARLGEALAGLGAQRSDLRAEAADLALAIARRVLPQVAGNAMLGQLIETAAAELQDEEPHAVRVRPEEADRAEEALAGSGVAVEADDTLTDGQAVLVTRGGTAEAGLEARLGVLMEALRG